MDLGSDFAGILDIDATLSVCSGWRNLGNALARRLTTPAGALFYDPDYGFDLRAQLNAAVRDTTKIEARIEKECLKDKRVARARASVTFDGDALTVTIAVVPKTGSSDSFSLVMFVSALTVETLLQKAA